MRPLLSSAALALLGACSSRPTTADSSEVEAKSRPPTTDSSISPSNTGSFGQQTATGHARIRRGLPGDWVAGDKTGTCGNAYNDIAWFVTPEGREYTLTVYLDRPTVGMDGANAAIASVARAAVQTISRP